MLITAQEHKYGHDKVILEVHDEDIGKDIPIEEIRNYHLFKNLNIMGSEYTSFIGEHFGQYAVLKVSFRCCDVIAK